MATGACVRRVLGVIALSAGLAGCSATGAGADEVPSSADLPGTGLPDAAGDPASPACTPPELRPCAASECGPVTDLATADDVTAYLRAATWNLEEPWCVVMGEVRVQGPLEIDAAALSGPTGCAGSACTPRFRMFPDVPGVSCVGPSAGTGLFCDRIRIEAAQLRVRANLLKILGIAGKQEVSVLDVLGACATPCGTDQFTGPDHTCWMFESQLCTGSLGGTRDACSCRQGGEVLPDGTECPLNSGDVIGNGWCTCGVCKSHR